MLNLTNLFNNLLYDGGILLATAHENHPYPNIQVSFPKKQLSFVINRKATTR